ncbi:MAG: hypothetical protein K0U40_05465 [Betaproteobacteria bacterium]|nr:hypothetical protein [Betaproteobacteria bacterium]
MNTISEMELSELQFEFQRIDDELAELDELCDLLDLEDAHFSGEFSEEHQTFDTEQSEYDYWS